MNKPDNVDECVHPDRDWLKDYIEDRKWIMKSRLQKRRLKLIIARDIIETKVH